MLQALYALELSGNSVEEVGRELLSETEHHPRVLQFARQLLAKTYECREEFDELTRAKAFNWEVDRIAILDRLVLRMAMCEFLYFEDIPPKVSIDEAIELAKKYSTENSGKFVNGILDAVLSDLRNQGRVFKTGRGLDEGEQVVVAEEREE